MDGKVPVETVHDRRQIRLNWSRSQCRLTTAIRPAVTSLARYFLFAFCSSFNVGRIFFDSNIRCTRSDDICCPHVLFCPPTDDTTPQIHQLSQDVAIWAFQVKTATGARRRFTFPQISSAELYNGRTIAQMDNGIVRYRARNTRHHVSVDFSAIQPSADCATIHQVNGSIQKFQRLPSHVVQVPDDWPKRMAMIRTGRLFAV